MNRSAGNLVRTGVFWLVISAVSAIARATPPVRLNDITVLGTHHSYKQAMPAQTFRRLLIVAPTTH